MQGFHGSADAWSPTPVVTVGMPVPVALPVTRTILVFDMERSTRPECTNPIKAELRRQVYRILHEALIHAGVGEGCFDMVDRGDGALVLIHQADTVPKIHLLSRFVPEFTRLLADYNKGLSVEDQAGRMVRLRVVVHAGEVHTDTNGCFGEAVDVACRLLDSTRLKRCLRGCAAPLVLAVSDEIYWAIVRHEYDGICAATYAPDVRVTVSGRRHLGWVHVPASG